jgi:hypothetical protein
MVQRKTFNAIKVDLPRLVFDLSFRASTLLHTKQFNLTL